MKNNFRYIFILEEFYRKLVDPEEVKTVCFNVGMEHKDYGFIMFNEVKVTKHCSLGMKGDVVRIIKNKGVEW